MPSRAATLLGDLGREVSSRISLMRSVYYFSAVVPESRRITYGVTLVYLMIWSLCMKVLWMDMPHISGLVILEWESS